VKFVTVCYLTLCYSYCDLVGFITCHLVGDYHCFGGELAFTLQTEAEPQTF